MPNPQPNMTQPQKIIGIALTSVGSLLVGMSFPPLQAIALILLIVGLILWYKNL